jgi:hypothetical protein
MLENAATVISRTRAPIRIVAAGIWSISLVWVEF